jgi:hypothetical protein
VQDRDPLGLELAGHELRGEQSLLVVAAARAEDLAVTGVGEYRVRGRVQDEGHGPAGVDRDRGYCRAGAVTARNRHNATVEEFLRGLCALLCAARVIRFHDLDLAAVHAARRVDLVGGDSRGGEDVLARRGGVARQRDRHADLDGVRTAAGTAFGAACRERDDQQTSADRGE